MDRKEKIRNILKAIKFDVADVEVFDKELDAILGMFNAIQSVDVGNVSPTLNRKKVCLADLREDVASDKNQLSHIRGTYFSVPNVSKK